jgi:hypothetical protein
VAAELVLVVRLQGAEHVAGGELLQVGVGHRLVESRGRARSRRIIASRRPRIAAAMPAWTVGRGSPTRAATSRWV